MLLSWDIGRLFTFSIYMGNSRFTLPTIRPVPSHTANHRSQEQAQVSFAPQRSYAGSQQSHGLHVLNVGPRSHSLLARSVGQISPSSAALSAGQRSHSETIPNPGQNLDSSHSTRAGQKSHSDPGHNSGSPHSTRAGKITSYQNPGQIPDSSDSQGARQTLRLPILSHID